jgi:hypothetical protein
VAFIDALDSDHHLKERFNLVELESMGFVFSRKPYGFLLTYGSDFSYVLRQKPHDYFGQVSQVVQYSPEITGRK